MTPPSPARCPHCDAPLTRVVSQRYDVCQVCPKTRGIHVYVPVGDAPPHWMHGTAVGEGIFDAKTATNAPMSAGVTTTQRGRRPKGRAR